MTVIIIDYWMWNLSSIKNSVEKLWYKVEITNEHSKILSAQKLILPWVWSFSEWINNIKKLWLDNIINESINKDIPLLWICLWMQLLWTYSYEGWKNMWLNLIPGSVIKFEANNNEKIPHVWWNNVTIYDLSSPLFDWINNNSDFYFVHSYLFKTDNTNHILWTTEYINNFTSVINKWIIYWVQFHPEKSWKIWLKLLDNFLRC